MLLPTTLASDLSKIRCLLNFWSRYQTRRIWKSYCDYRMCFATFKRVETQPGRWWRNFFLVWPPYALRQSFEIISRNNEDLFKVKLHFSNIWKLKRILNRFPYRGCGLATKRWTNLSQNYASITSLFQKIGTFCRWLTRQELKEMNGNMMKIFGQKGLIDFYWNFLERNDQVSSLRILHNIYLYKFFLVE